LVLDLDLRSEAAGAAMSIRKSKHQQYMAYAEHCLEIAKITADETSRSIQQEMAAEWLSLADVVSLNSAKTRATRSVSSPDMPQPTSAKID
jgi:hypothetical protein